MWYNLPGLPYLARGQSRVNHGKRQMRTISTALLLPILLIYSAPALVHAQGGDGPAPPHASAQHVRFEHLTADQGLSSNIACGVVQGNHGLIWIGTLDGLNRYDGNTFKIYR
jgi:hypothetical protein